MGDYKLIVLDVDGTLARRKHQVSKINILALERATDMNIKIALASGRSVDNLRVIFNQLTLHQKDIIGIAYNGAVVYDFNQKRIMSKKVIANDVLQDVFALAETNRLLAWAYDANNRHQGFVNSRRSIFYRFLEMHTRRKRLVLSRDVYSEAYKIILGGSKRVIAEVCGIIKKKYDCNIFDFSYVTKHRSFVEIVPPGSDKLNGIKMLCNHWNVKQDEVMVFGDGSNDRAMIEWAGCGVAMGNAKDKLKAVANVTTLSNRKDGVAHMINQKIFQKK